MNRWPEDPNAPKSTQEEVAPRVCVSCGEEYKTWKGGSNTHCYACRTKIEDAGRYVYTTVRDFINSVVLLDFLPNFAGENS